MITEKLNTSLINAIKEKLPDGVNVANTLMDILYLGKEAIYRRLRGEVPFTLAEAATISQKLGVSIDRLIGTNFSGNSLFDLNLVHYKDPIETYYSIVNTYVDIFRNMRNDPESELGTASNIIPQTFYLKYEYLSKFRLFKWIYQHEKIDFSKCFEEMKMSDKLLQKQREFVSESQHIQSTCYIWDSSMFSDLVNDIKYFTSIRLISEENEHKLKEELLLLVDELEEIATKGKFTTGKDVQIYISHINFEATYSYIQTQYEHLSLIRIFSINSITSRDTEVFESLKDWIMSLKKFSTLITQSGEMQRIQFFVKQREIINSL